MKAFDLFTRVVLVLAPVYIWSRFFKKWKHLLDQYSLDVLDDKRHNSVVMYSRDRGAVGWPQGPVTCSSVKTPTCYESILYFISTARNSIDIAIMVIAIDKFVKALQEVSKRGVVVRLVVDNNFGNKECLRKLIAAGVQVRYYVCPDNVCSIFHYKIMLKDYRDGRGFAYVGSMNWTETAIKTHFEDTVFSTSNEVVAEVHKNFKEAWDYTGMLRVTKAVVRERLQKKKLC